MDSLEYGSESEFVYWRMYHIRNISLGSPTSVKSTSQHSFVTFFKTGRQKGIWSL